jgi:hypothetical protein
MKTKRPRLSALFTGSALAAFLAAPSATNAAIHEMVAAFCSGGDVGVIGANGFLEPPGITDPTKRNFAQPVVSNGAAVVVSENPLRVEIGSSPAAKYPEGTVVVDLATFTFLAASQSQHPSTHCTNFSSLP